METNSGITFSHQLKKKETYPDRDRRIGEVENGPYPEIKKIDHGTQTNPVDPIPHRASKNQPDSPLRSQLLGRRTQPYEDEHNDTHGDDGEQHSLPALEESKGNPLILNQSQVEDAGQNGVALAGFKKEMG